MSDHEHPTTDTGPSDPSDPSAPVEPSSGTAAPDVGPDGDGPGADSVPDEPGTDAGAESVAMPGEEGDGGAADPVELGAEQIDALVADRDRYLDAYQRTAADFDNFRKQSQKRIADEVARSQGGFIERLLPVLDAIEAAQAHGSVDVVPVAEALFGFLAKEGLEQVRPDGEVFDPNVADAVMHEPGEGDEPVITGVLRTGYLWNGRVIRPAMVKVAG